MAENRYHELLGIPEEVEDPDYYQLLELDRSGIGNERVEARFKAQMTKLQQNENPRHKEFLEFLKGELKRARGILTDPARRSEYDKELAEERAGELHKLLSHMLVDGKLSSQAELSIIEEGRNLGLEGSLIRSVIDQELERTGARRVSSRDTSIRMQRTSDRKVQEFAKQLQEARMGARMADARARMADARARMAELQQKRAEEFVVNAQAKSRKAQALARRVINQGSIAEAMGEQTQHEREELEQRLQASELRCKKLTVALKELNDLRRRGGGDVRSPRLALTYASLFIMVMAGRALCILAPEQAASLSGMVSSSLQPLGPALAEQAPLLALGVLLLLTHLSAGPKMPVFVLPFIGMCLTALVLGLVRISAL